MSNHIALPPQLCKQRRDALRELVKSQSSYGQESLVILGADFESSRYAFRQESSFYYFTGITEPGVVLFMYSDGRDVLYLPNFEGRREQWVTTTLRIDEECKKQYYLDQIAYLGASCPGYAIRPLFNKNEYDNLLEDLGAFLHNENNHVFMAIDATREAYYVQLAYHRFFTSVYPDATTSIEDCSSFIEELRRAKDKYELECMYRAAQITAHAQKAAAGIIAPGKYEYEIKAVIESAFTLLNADGPAFPSIVAAGKNSTVLHYTDQTHELKDGDLVVIDIGASYNYYAADVTRTFPVNGRFTKRQREVYECVLETQRYIESLAVPGMFLKNAKEKEKSLHHKAVEFLEKRGYGRYFVHGIGHFLGLDVHDVGNTLRPLQPGDVITIEPGIYIPQENIGIRIEDDYVIADDACFCLSDDLVKAPQEIEALMKERYADFTNYGNKQL